MMRLAQDQNIELGNQFYWNACSCCGMLWIPVTFTARLWSYRRLRAAAHKDRFIFLSKIMSGERKKKKKKANYIVYRCGSCDRYSVFDNYPLELSTEGSVMMAKPTEMITKKDTAEERRKMAQLQKILQRSKSITTTKTSSGLGDFLKGLDPKLDKK